MSNEIEQEEERAPILMSAENPNGWKLEELLEVIAEELATKTERLNPDDCPVNPDIIRNNHFIYTHLMDCASIQKHTMKLIDNNNVLGEIEGEFKQRGELTKDRAGITNK